MADVSRERVLFEHLGEPAVEIRFEGNTPVVRDVNESFEAVFGVDEQSIVGDSLDTHIVPVDDGDTARDINQRAADGEHVEEPVQRQTSDGPRWFLLRSVPFTESDQQCGYGIYVDITQRKRQEERFQALIERSTDIITILEPDGTYRYQSSSVEHILGYDPEMMVGENAFEYLHPDDRDEVMEVFARAVEDPEMVPTAEYRFRHSDGSWRWLESIGNNQLDNPAVEGFVVNSRDITERKEQEKRLREIESKYDALGRALPDYAFLYDEEGRYVDALLGWEEEAGRLFTADELVGKSVHDILSEDAAAAVMETIQDAVATGEVQTTTYDLETPSGPHRYEGRAAPIEDRAESETAVVFTARDVTERFETRRELRNRNERLNQFVSVVSHDLRNPLNVASGRIELARERLDSDSLDVAADALNRMESIIDETLVLAKQDQSVAETKPVPASSLTNQCWRVIATEDAEFRCVDEFAIHCNEDRLRHLFENLFRNAVEHTSGNVTVRVGRIEDEGFYVEDDGSGIPADERENVFETGYTTAEDGTGFGLDIVDAIAEAHDWSITVTESDEGGARFEFTGVDIAD